MHVRLLALAALALCSVGATGASAQVQPPAGAQSTPPRGAVRGVVRSTLGGRISYAVVTLEPGIAPRFTDDSGVFVIPGIVPGPYVLRARQVGYKPFDTTLVVPEGGAVVVAVALEHFVVELEAIHVVAHSAAWDHCTAPGPPDPTVNPDFAAVFDQLRQNAERYWLLADSYPALYRMERQFGPGVWRTDTIELRTDTRWRYAPGRVVTDIHGPHGTEKQLNLPGLPDFADSAFLSDHCFRYAGFETMDGKRYARLDFRVADAIASPDADGSALLDPDTYLIRFVRVELTKPDLASISLDAMEATVTFREVMPSLVLPDHISSWQSNLILARFVRSVEEQQMVKFTFLRSLPTERP